MPKLWLFCTIWYFRVTLWIKIFTKDPSFPPATLGRRKTWLWGSLGGPWGWSNQILWNQNFQTTSNSPSGGQSLEKCASEGGVAIGQKIFCWFPNFYSYLFIEPSFIVHTSLNFKRTWFMQLSNNKRQLITLSFSFFKNVNPIFFLTDSIYLPDFFQK